MESDLIFGPVRTALTRSRGRLPIIEQATGVPVSTLYKIVQGATPNPGVLTVEKLYRYFLATEPDLLKQEASRVQ